MTTVTQRNLEYHLRRRGAILLKKLIVLLGLIMLMTACGTKTINFSGESDHWSANLRVTQTDKRQEEDFNLHYLGNDIESVGEFSYVVESVGNFSGNGEILNENGTMTSGGACEGCAFTSENTEVIVIVEWNDQTETFQLENE